MEPSDIPGPVQVFLRTYIESYEELELLLLVRDRATTWCSGSELGAAFALRALPVNVDEVLARLRQRGLLEGRDEPPPPSYRYQPRDMELELGIDGLATRYRDDPTGVMKLMTANALERVRSQAARTLIQRSGSRSSPSAAPPRDKKEG